jgi:hypothetical protein
MSVMENRQFYHSFPRPRREEDDAAIVSRGLKILTSIKERGLILAPEVVTWKQSFQNGTERVSTLRQFRICFTELSRAELPQHVERFGPFSIGFELDVLRRLGALPVSYMPQRVAEDCKLSNLGNTLVTQLIDVKYTLGELQKLADVSNPAVVSRGMPVDQDYKIRLQNLLPDGREEPTAEVPAKVVRQVLSHIAFRNAPYDLMIGVLSHLQGLFYPTDDEIHDELLAYYRQREWRILPGWNVDGIPHGRELRPEEKKKLLEIDGGFWSREVKDASGTFRRVDQAFIIDQFENRSISDFISSAIVPPAAAADARRLFGDKVSVDE